MTLDVSTPALLFPAISLLFLSFTNRFLHLASLVRQLYGAWTERGEETLLRQISNIRRRLILIRWMQVFGALSLFLCVISMLAVIGGSGGPALVSFGAALTLMGLSLGCLVVEVWISGGALGIQLEALEMRER